MDNPKPDVIVSVCGDYKYLDYSHWLPNSSKLQSKFHLAAQEFFEDELKKGNEKRTSVKISIPKITPENTS